MKKGETSKSLHSHVFRVILFLVLVASLILPTASGVKAAGDRFTLNITYGFDNQARIGSTIPFNITITNNGGDFKGSVQVILPRRGKNEMYEKDLALAAGATKTVSINAPIELFTTSANVRICNEKGKPVQTQLVNVRIIRNISTINIGVLSDDFSALSYLSGVQLFDSGSYGKISTRIFELDEETFPTDNRSFNMLDFILISNYSTDKLSDAQLSALNEWVLNGGVVILGTGSTVSKTLSGIKALPAFRAVKTDGIQYFTCHTTYGINSADPSALEVQQISSGYYDGDYRYSELASYGSSVYQNVTEELSKAAKLLLEEKGDNPTRALEGEDVFEKFYLSNTDYIWLTFASNMGFDASMGNDRYYEKKFKEQLYRTLPEPFCVDAAIAAEAGNAAETPTGKSEYVQAEITKIDIDMGSSNIYLDDRDNLDSLYPLSKTYQYGLGRVNVVSVDFTQNPFASFKDRALVVRMLLNGAHGIYMTDLIRKYNDNSGNYYSGYSEYQFLFSPLTSVSAPPALLYISLLILYLVLTFVSFSILKKKRKNVFFWVSQAGLALVFGILIFIFSFTTKITGGEFRTAQFKELTGRSERDLNVSAFVTPSKKKYRITLMNKYGFAVEPNGDNFYTPNPGTSLDDYALGINIRPEDSTFIVNNSGALNSTFFAGTYIDAEKQGSFVVDGTFDENNPDITVTNNSGYDLKRVVIIGPSKYILLGDLANGQSVKVDARTDFSYSRSIYSMRISGDSSVRDYLSEGTGFNFVNLMFGTNSEWYKRSMMRIYEVHFLRQQYMEKDSSSSEFLICGFPDSNVSEPFQPDKKFKEITHTLVFQNFEDNGSFSIID